MLISDSRVHRVLEALEARGLAIREAADTAPGLSVEEAELLLSARGTELERLLELASEVRDEGLRRAGRPGVITFSKKVFLPITYMCRDRCHYCTFVKTPAQLLSRGEPLFMPPEQLLAVATQGAALGCKEALFTLGDRPEDRWPEAREWLDQHGYSSTLHYVRDMAQLVRERTGLLPHLNPGVMTAEELAWLRPVAPSMGMMLETTSVELWAEPGRAHYGSPDKQPEVRLRVIDDAGEARIPFTTGILVGIGETVRDRAESLAALRQAHLEHGHVQEVIVQNFRAKPQTAMRDESDLETEEYLAAIATARLMMGPDMRLQVPPNLADQRELELLVRAGIDDWGGVSPLTADHVNPERPWPSIVALRERTEAAGFALKERLTVYPPYIAAAHEWIDPGLVDAIAPLVEIPSADDASRGLASESARPTGAGGSSAGRSMHLVPGSSIRGALERARERPDAIADADLELLLLAEGEELDGVVELADLARLYTVGDAVTFVSNCTVDPSAFGPETTPAEGLDEIARIAASVAARGATEICVQGRLPQNWAGDDYLRVARAVKQAAPDLHLHAFRPDDIVDGASRAGRKTAEFIAALRDAGVDTIPGTGVKMLDETHRREAAPADLAVGAWISVVSEAHRAGLPSTSVAVYGLGESPQVYVRHLRSLTRIQAETGGFTELVVMPVPGGGAPLLPGRSERDEHRARCAVARLAVNGSINRVQTGWTRIGLDLATEMLRSGANDLGGLLLHEGSVTGGGAPYELGLDDVRRVGKKVRRPVRQRTTLYGAVEDRRQGGAPR